MRILILTQYFWPENFRINDVSQGLKSQGHDVSVLTGLPNYPEGRVREGYGLFRRSREVWNGIDIVRVPLVPRGRGGNVSLALNYLSFMLSASLLAPIRCRGPYDVIFVYEPSPVTVGIPAIALKFLRRVPIVFWVQDLWPESLEATGAVGSKRILRMVAALVRFIYRHCDAILVQSRAFVGSVSSHGAPERKISYLPNSAESFYRPVDRDACAREDAELPKGFRVLFAGNIGAAQDFETIIAAATLTRHIENLHWIVIGDGRARSWVEEQVSRNDLAGSFHILGARAAEIMPNYFSVADVLLVTLKKNPIFAMTIPSKVQSYLACGKPLIGGLDGEGARVISEAGAGLACPAESPSKLADAVESLSRLPAAELARMGANARRFYEKNFERSMLLSRLEAILRSNTVRPA